MPSELPLRPHHGLCLGFFQGKGYSDAFSRNMADVLASLAPDSPVRLVSGHDAICARCPKRHGPCPNAGDYDRRVLSLCGLQPGQSLAWGEFREAVYVHVLHPGKLADVCGSCRWSALCQEHPMETYSVVPAGR